MGETGDIAATISSVAKYLECLYPHEDGHEIQSVVHDAWLRLSSAGKPLNGGWLFSEAKSILWANLRRNRRRRQRMQAGLRGDEPARERVAGTELPCVRDAVDGLTDSQRFVVHGIVAGETVVEQADEAGVSVSAIKERIQSVRNRFRRLLNPDGTATGVKAKSGSGRTDKKVFFRGRMMTLKAVAEEVGLAYATVHRRVFSGMSVEDAVTRPIIRGGNHR